jgi:hypothetical protein
MWGTDIGSAALIATFLGAAAVAAGCGAASGTSQGAPDASMETGGFESGNANDGPSDGMVDSAPPADALLDADSALDAGSAQDADGQTDGGVGPCVPLGQCSCGLDAGTCAAGCVATVCGPPSACACAAPKAICVDPQNGTCDCGFALIDHCAKPRSHCLCTSCADAPGAICVTDAQQSALCSGPFRSAFACP